MSGKDGGFPLPSVIDPDRVCVRLNIPNDPDHMAAFWGCLWLLTYWNQWQRDGAHTGTQVAAVWKDVWFEAKAINDHLDGCETMPFDVRQNSMTPCILEKTEDNVNWTPFANLRLCPPMIRLGATGGYEVSTDDGETWTPVDQAPPTPRTPGDPDNRCLAVANAVAVLVALHYEIVRNYAPAIPVLALAVAVAAAVLALVGFPIGAAALGGLLEALLLYAAELTNEAFTTEVQEELQCILYCNAEDNAGVVTFDFDAVQDAVQENSGIADIWNVIEIYLLIVQEDGLNRAGATTSITSAECDCPDCPETWCYEFDFTVSDGGFSTYGTGSYVSGQGWETGLTFVGGNPARGRRQVQLFRDVSTTITHAEMMFTYTGGVTTEVSPTGIYANTFAILLSAGVAPSVTSPQTWDGIQTITRIDLSLGVGGRDTGGDPGGTGLITKLILHGIGVNPFGPDNCEA